MVRKPIRWAAQHTIPPLTPAGWGRTCRAQGDFPPVIRATSQAIKKLSDPFRLRPVKPARLLANRLTCCPNEAALAMILTHELGTSCSAITSTPSSPSTTACSFPKSAPSSAWNFARDRNEEEAADKKARRVAQQPPYSKLGNAGLFLKSRPGSRSGTAEPDPGATSATASSTATHQDVVVNDRLAAI